MWVKKIGYQNHNSAVPDAFAEVVKVTNDTGLSDAELTWYPLGLHARFVSMASEFLVLGLPNIAWLWRF